MLYNINQKIGNYVIVFPLCQNSESEEYTVKSQDGTYRHLKLIHKFKLSSAQFDKHRQLNEVEIAKRVVHPNICHYEGHFRVENDGKEYVALITDFVSGETLQRKISRTGRLPIYEIDVIAKGLLEALHYLHTRETPIIHNSISTGNILLDMSCSEERVLLNGFGCAQFANQKPVYPSMETNEPPFFAPERLLGYNTVQTDLYAVGIVLFQMIFGKDPWDKRAKEKEHMGARINLMLHELANDPSFLVDENDFANRLLPVVMKATNENPEKRYASAAEMLHALTPPVSDHDPATHTVETTGETGNNVEFYNDIAIDDDDYEAKGFSAIAGMEEQKQLLRRIVNILEKPRLARKYRLPIPNGILFYGPPGCGKTFLAQKFAEESGFNFISVKPSDIASTYIHGTQELIRKLFDKARTKAPSILYFDEFDSMVPKRDLSTNTHQKGEVNEFLSQLNNCGKNRILVIASTNQPFLIDDAILRSGRFDKKIYIPLPDEATREEMFRLQLNGRPCEDSIDFPRLAKLTEKYITSDIEQIVNEASFHAFIDEKTISQQLIEKVISESNPSLSKRVCKEYEKMRAEFESGGENSSMGFLRNYTGGSINKAVCKTAHHH